MMTLVDFVYLNQTINGPKRGEKLDQYLNLGKRIIMVIFWALDLLVLLHRTGMIKGNANYIMKPQMNIYVVNLIFSFILQIRRYIAARDSLATIESTNTEAILAAEKKKKDVCISIAKLCCDMLSAIDGSGLLWVTFGISINEALISVASLCSAFISLRSLFTSS